jgi:hypothetical protein
MNVNNSIGVLKRRALCALPAAAAVAACLATAGPADASLLGLGLGGVCPSQALTQPFARWGDSNKYELAPAGDFEGSLSSWSLEGGAAKVAGSDSYDATGSAGKYSLQLPAGAVAISPPICVSSADPSFRLFVRSTSGTSAVRIETEYAGLVGLLSGLLTPNQGLSTNTTWQPSAMLSTSLGLPTLLGTAVLQLRFTGVKGTTQLDDVFIDPHGRG